MQIWVTWADGVRAQLDLANKYDSLGGEVPALMVRRADCPRRRLIVCVGTADDGAPRYVEDSSGPTTDIPRGRWWN